MISKLGKDKPVIHKTVYVSGSSEVIGKVRIGDNCLIGAGTVVTENKVIPDCSLVLGVPGRVIRQLNQEEITQINNGAMEYLALTKKYRKRNI